MTRHIPCILSCKHGRRTSGCPNEIQHCRTWGLFQKVSSPNKPGFMSGKVTDINLTFLVNSIYGTCTWSRWEYISPRQFHLNQQEQNFPVGRSSTIWNNGSMSGADAHRPASPACLIFQQFQQNEQQAGALLYRAPGLDTFKLWLIYCMYEKG